MDQVGIAIISLLGLAINGNSERFGEEMVNYPRDARAWAQVEGYHGRTPLHLAAMRGHEDIVNLIMSSEHISIPVVNAKDCYGLTPLHLAVRSKKEHIVRILTTSLWVLPDRFTAATSVKDELKLVCEGFTPLHLAAWTGNIPIVKLVLRQAPCQDGTGYDPVNIHATTWEGLTPLDIAKERHHVVLVDLLECFDVNWLQAERERSASSASAILVGAALVAAVAFGCWLQPPLGIPDMDARNNVLGIPHLRPQVRTKLESWFFVSVAFSLALSVMALVTGTLAIIPSRRASLKREVRHLRKSVQTASVFLFMAILFLAQAAHYAGLLVFRTVAFADGVVSSAGDQIVRYTSLFCLVYIFVLVVRMERVYGAKIRGVVFVSVLAVVAVYVIQSAISKCFFHEC